MNVQACAVDTDGDTVPDSTDNCDSVSNLDQLNNDADAEGDACDTDDDNDTILDGPDNCDLVANLTQTDTDGDGAGNACENEAYVTIAKETTPDGASDVFNFSGSLGEGASLADGESVDFSVANPEGSYWYGETVPEGWTLTDIDCGLAEGEGGDATVFLGEEGVSFDLEDDDDVTCTFTNTEDTPTATGSITIVKQTNPDGASDIFDFTGTGFGEGGDLESFSLSDNGSETQNGLAAGTYYVTELETEGWDLTSMMCDDSDSTSHDGESGTEGFATINLQTGESVTCTFTNTAEETACSTEDDDIAFYLPFDEGEGPTANDESLGGTMDGTLTNGPLFSSDVPTLGFSNPYGLEFDGTDDYVDLANGSFPTPFSFSISAWVKADTIGIDRQIVSKGYNGTQTEWEMKTTSADGKVSIQTYNAGQFGVQSLTPLVEDAWTHVVGTFDGTTWSIYLDGSLDNSAVAAAPVATNRPIYVGAVDNQGTPVQFWDGNLDDVRFYGRALTADEVSDLYGGACDADDTPTVVCGNEIEESGEQCDDGNVLNGDGCSNTCQDELAACITTDDYLVAHWEFDAGTGSVAFDATDHNNEGAVNGASWTTGPVTSFYNPFALSFDGTDDVVEVTDKADLDITSVLTVSAWVRSQGPSDYGVIAGTTDAGDMNGYYITINQSTGFPTIYSLQNPGYQSAVVSTSILNDGNWHHLAGTFDGTNLTMYLDGVAGTPVPATAPTVNMDMFRMGASLYPGRYFTGDIDDVRVYNTGLSAAQVSNLAGGACDAGVTAPPEEDDIDLDGVADDDDNCPLAQNTSQTDSDLDGIGNACDETPNGPPGPEGNEGGNNGNPQGNGSRRGKRTNVLGSLVSMFGGEDTQDGDVAPGAFGGPGEEEFTEAETELICTIRKAIPQDVKGKDVYQWVAEELAGKMPHSVEAILEEIINGNICPSNVVAAPRAAKPVAFHVDSLGYPVSSNDTWNKCIRGTATLQDIRNNPDRDEDGYGYSCSRYHTSTTWRHPDLGVYFMWKKLSKSLSLPAGYAIKQDVTVTQN